MRPWFFASLFCGGAKQHFGVLARSPSAHALRRHHYSLPIVQYSVSHVTASETEIELFQPHWKNAEII